MQIDLKELQKDHERDHVITCDFSKSELSYNGSSYLIAEKKPFELRLRNEDDRKLLLNAETEIKVRMNCDRCLEEVIVPISISVDQSIPMLDGNPVTDDPEDAVSFIEEKVLDVDQMIEGEIFLMWPTKVLCQEDCKGLCSVCGQNLNIRDCGCNREVLDPRMARFQDVFNQMKEV